MESVGNSGQQIIVDIPADSQQTVTCVFTVVKNPTDFGRMQGAVYIANGNGYTHDLIHETVRADGTSSGLIRVPNVPDLYITFNVGQRYTVVTNNTGIWVDGEKILTGDGGAGGSGLPYLLFRHNDWGLNTDRIYSFVINKEGDLCNLVPALDSAGVPCMYDRVSNTPKYNTRSGAFIAGIETLSQLYSLLAKLPDLTGQEQKTLKIRLDAALQTDELRAMIDERGEAKNWEITEAA